MMDSTFTIIVNFNFRLNLEDFCRAFAVCLLFSPMIAQTVHILL